MTQNKFEVPILFILFNRPDKVEALITALKPLQPATIYVAADGPRPHVPTDTEKCRRVREIATSIPWPCEIHTHFQENNLGVDKGMEEAMTWFYQNVAEGIICEDDCIPHSDFLLFAEELLKKYQHDEKVMLISGTNFQDNKRQWDTDYYFSHYPTWGYAMWRRTWEKFDSDLSGFPEFVKKKKIDNVLKDPKQKKFWLSFFKKIYKGKFNFTDTRLMFSIWNANGVCIIPRVNLVKNIGFDEEATHPTVGNNLSVETNLIFNKELVHPTEVSVDYRADDYFFYKIHNTNFFQKVLLKSKIIGKNLIKLLTT